MWDFLLNSKFILGSAWAWVEHFTTTTLAIAFLIGAFAVYGYSLVDPRIPRFIVSPIVAILVFAGAWIYGSRTATDYQISQCDIRFNLAQKVQDDKNLVAAAQIKGLEQKLNATLVSQAAERAKNHSELIAALDDAQAHPSKDELIPPMETDNGTSSTSEPIDIPDYVPSATPRVTPPVTIVVQKPRTCLDAAIPTRVLSILQRTNPRPVTTSD